MHFTAFLLMIESAGTVLLFHKTCKNLLTSRPSPFCQLSLTQLKEAGAQHFLLWVFTGFRYLEGGNGWIERRMAYKAKQHNVAPFFVCRYLRTF